MSKEKALNSVSAMLGIPPAWLDSLIQFESGWRPDVKNPYSSARGLIQFTDSTAKGLGFKDSADLVNQYPTIEKQLAGPVLKYLSQFRPFPSEQSLYMSVFYPRYRNVSPDTVFAPEIRAVNPGIMTVQDYINKVKRVSLVKTGKSIGAAVLIIGAVVFGYIYFTKGQGAKLWEQLTRKNETPQVKIVKELPPDEEEEEEDEHGPEMM